MKLIRKSPPRRFSPAPGIELQDHGDIRLEPDQQVTMVTPAGARMDVAAKNWGFYATPSVNDRLVNEGFKTALVQNTRGQIYVMVVEQAKQTLFADYCTTEKQTVLEWLDERPLFE